MPRLFVQTFEHSRTNIKKMANLNPPHVLLNEEYANPVIYRMPSPASSIGTVYGLDDTAHSDTEYKISDSDAFNKEEFEADRDPLLTIPQSGGVPVRISERELDHVEERRMWFSFLSLSLSVSRVWFEWAIYC